MADTETSTPDIQTQVIILSIVRAVLLILGTFGVTWAQTVSGSVIEQAAGAGAILVGIAWSLYQKFQQARLDHAGNVASARAGKAIKVVSQDGVPPV
jgi:protein-S-isoprenylcysteine O-methyltransferase Ste14